MVFNAFDLVKTLEIVVVNTFSYSYFFNSFSIADNLSDNSL